MVASRAMVGHSSGLGSRPRRPPDGVRAHMLLLLDFGFPTASGPPHTGEHMNSPRLAVIIVTYRRYSALLRLLNSLQNQDLPRDAYELCVIDNGADVPRNHPLVKSVDQWRTANNIGASAARNLGATVTTAPLLVFIDDDGVVATDFLTSMVTLFDAEQTVIAARGRVVSLDHPCLSAIARHYDRGPFRCDELLIIEGATGIRRAAFEAAGGFDSNLFGGEGLELSERLLTANPNGRIVYEPACVLRHDFVDSFVELWLKARRQTRSSVAMHTGHETLRAATARYATYSFTDYRARHTRLLGWTLRILFSFMQRLHHVRLQRQNNKDK